MDGVTVDARLQAFLAHDLQPPSPTLTQPTTIGGTGSRADDMQTLGARVTETNGDPTADLTLTGGDVRE